MYTLILALMVLLPTPREVALGQQDATGDPDCFEDMFCISSEQRGDTVDVYVSNLLPWEFTMSMDLELENMKASTPLPFVHSYPGRKRTHALSLSIERKEKSWTYRFDLRWILGSLGAKHDDNYTYALPFRRGESHLVGQGFNGGETHQGKYAIDWDMPERSEVHAARGGIVVDLKESFVEGGLEDDLKTRANFVKIRHSDGSIGHYVHLEQNGVRVHVGDRVKRGDLIAYSGNTGYSSGPHLHFEVYTVTKELARRTIKIQFNVDGQRTDHLVTGRYYGH